MSKSQTLNRLFTPPSNFVSGTWAQLEVLRSAGRLVIGKRYLMTDYQHKYQINASDSSLRNYIGPIVGAAGLYAKFDVLQPAIVVGDVVTVSALPPAYVGPITVGSTATATIVFGPGYIQFAPVLNVNGMVITYSKQRYSNVANGATINDAGGRPIIQPGGVLNTAVHDGAAYADMTAGENPAVPVEQLILTAISATLFSRAAESLTFANDGVIYDFSDTQIINDNLILMGTRNGFVSRRTNEVLGVSVGQDWRAQRYRRYKMDDTSLANWRLGNKPLYTRNGIAAYCTTTSHLLADADKYLMRQPEQLVDYLDFTKTVPDPFLTGETVAPSVNAGTRLWVDKALPYMVDLIVGGFTGACKDFTILPLVSGYAPSPLVSRFRVSVLDNSVFLPNDNNFGSSGRYSVDHSGSIVDCTVLTGSEIIGGGTLKTSILVDQMYMRISSSAEVARARFLSPGEFRIAGTLSNTTFGSSIGTGTYVAVNIDAASSIYNSIFGATRFETIAFSGLACNRCLITANAWSEATFEGTAYFTRFNTSSNQRGTTTRLSNFVNQNAFKQLARTGTVVIVAASAALVGTGTLFTTELIIGSVIRVAGNEYTVLSITNDTAAVLAAPAALPASGVYTRRFSAFGYVYNYATAQQDVTHTTDNGRKDLLIVQPDATYPVPVVTSTVVARVA